MAKRYKPRRTKLKSHDAGHDRHQKGVAYENKRARLALERGTPSKNPRRQKPRH